MMKIMSFECENGAHEFKLMLNKDVKIKILKTKLHKEEVVVVRDDAEENDITMAKLKGGDPIIVVTLEEMQIGNVDSHNTFCVKCL